SNKAAADFDPDGIHLSELGYVGVSGEIPIQLGTGPGPSDQKLTRYEALRSAIRKKNELFFHRWRPENRTYLFGFRKQEQGQNAREIPEFDPLVAEQEKKIAELRQPGKYLFELERVDPTQAKTKPPEGPTTEASASSKAET